jgi:hypothetical protein
MADLNQEFLRTAWRAYYYVQRDKRLARTGEPLRPRGRPKKVHPVHQTLVSNDVSTEQYQNV